MGLTLQFYYCPEPYGVNTYLKDGTYRFAVDYNGVDFAMPSGEIRIQLPIQQGEIMLETATHFVVFINPLYNKPRVFRITGCKSVNARVSVLTYTLDYLKDYYINSSNPGVLNTAPIIKEFGVASQSDNWARWRDDPTYPSMGGCTYELAGGNYTTGYMNVLVVANGMDAACRPKVYLLGSGATETLINYLNTSPYASAFYKQIIGFYLVPHLAGDWAGAGVQEGKLLGDFTVNNESLTYSGIDEDGNAFTDTVMTGVPHLTITGDVFTNIYTGISITLSDFIDIYHTSYNMYIPYVGNVELPIRLWAKVARAQTSSYTVGPCIRFSYNFYDGTFVMSFENTVSKITTNPPMTPCLFKEQIPMPSIPLPSGAQAFSFYSNKINLKSQVAGLAVQGATAGLTGDVTGTAMSLINMGMAKYRAELHNDLIQASGQSYGACSGFSGSTLNQFMLVIISEVYYQTYDVYSGMNGFIPLNPILDADDYYPDIAGRTCLFDTTNLLWHRPSTDDYPYEYFKGLAAQIEGQPVYFAPVFVPTT